MPRFAVETESLAQAAALVQQAAVGLRETAGWVRKATYEVGMEGAGGTDMVGSALGGFADALLRNLQSFAADAASISEALYQGEQQYAGTDTHTRADLQPRRWFVK